MTRSCESEESLEAYMRRQVARVLRGRFYKLLPGINKGIPDRMVLLPGGRIILVELKAEDGELSPAQKNVHRQMAEVGTHVPVLMGRAEVDAWIDEQYIDLRPAYKVMKNGSAWDYSSHYIDAERWRDRILFEEPDAEVEIQETTRHEMDEWRAS